jgi:hypothetical protein
VAQHSLLSHIRFSVGQGRAALKYPRHEFGEKRPDTRGTRNPLLASSTVLLASRY